MLSCKFLCVLISSKLNVVIYFLYSQCIEKTGEKGRWNITLKKVFIC